MDFSALTKKSSASFNQHKNLLKKLAKGNTVKCEKCQGILTLDLKTPKPGQGVAKCPKGCTEIVLELG
ncbi:MAG: hypothetical protein ACPG5Z_11880 [Pseudoalteromonas sp.]|uniref:hypothetical protein n=1 Tax=Pseudoalteromonas TaxID=53246 RepID=UPI0007321FEE|nr:MULTISPECIES: hypothetical protein [unclassified Pseudoalteromonas]MDB2355680.1 hypothetical protein [Pseudoalteromonas sp.]KTF09808.1 hypothetical protein ATS75_19615 [Pseudoalteromonas sp. H105]MDP2636793.1 hypothetical protein [Pseudoalteromonas sp. 1_MG-2023]PHN88210.1 hypothetical protein CSC79_19180 [Pseudoalteromonas sp. 3D05]TGE76272.1 hypothetical protein C7Y70_19560 [Pseudoalteromonas sp. KS88]